MEIENISISIEAKATKANVAIDRLIGKLDRLTVSLSKVKGHNLSSLAIGVDRLGNAMQTMNGVKTSDFTRLARNLSHLNTVDSSKLSSLASNVNHVATSFKNLGIAEASKQIADLSNGFKQFGYKSADKAIENMPKLAVAMRNLMKELSKAPMVSQNLIDMTKALAELSRTGASSGKAAKSLTTSIGMYSRRATKATQKTFSLASAFGKIYASYWLLFRMFRRLGDAIDLSSSLTEVQNVVDVTFGEYRKLLDNFAETSLQNFGIGELDAKKFASRFQSMGTAMGFSQGKMAEMSVELTKLTGDYASFYDVALSDVAEDFQSIFTGQTRPLRAYGLDLTEATLQEWAMRNGMQANINSMSQMEKTMLRYNYVMSNSEHIMGDFLRTSDSWHNMMTVLKGTIKDFASTIGTALINSLKPLVAFINNAIIVINEFAINVLNALGKIFGWTYEAGSGGFAGDYGEDLEDIGDGADGAADKVKKLKQQLQGIDELNVLTSDKPSGGGGGGGDTGEGGYEGNEGQFVFDDEKKLYESFIDNLYELGEYISETLTNVMNGIDWDSIYQGAKDFGKGLADFLNGLISPDLFGAVARTIAGSLNTALNFLHSFGKNFNFINFGNSIAEGINDFFETFDFKLLADTIKTWIKGAIDAVSTFFNKTDFEMIGETIGKFLADLDLASYLDDIADILWKALKAGFELLSSLASEAPLETTLIAVFSAFKFTNILSLLSGKFSDLFSEAFTAIKATDIWSKISTAIATLGSNIVYFLTEDLAVIFGAGTFVEIGATLVAGIAGAIAAAIGGFKLGEWLNENTGWGDIATWIVEDLGLGDLTVKILDIFDELPDKMKNLATKVMKGFKDGISEFIPIITTVFTNILTKIQNIFTGTKLYKHFKSVFREGVVGIKEYWNVANFKTLFSNILTGIKNVFANLSTWFKNTFTNAWNAVKNVFSTGGKIFDGITSAIYEVFKKVVNSLITGINKVVRIPFEKINEALNKIKSISILGSYPFAGLPTISIPQIPLLYTGGFPEDGWFRANHGEVMGRFDNGKSVVANNKQITDGIANAVYRGNREMVAVMQQELSETRRQNDILMGILQKETGISYKDVFNATQKGASEYTAMTGRPAFV